jgi:hypothetical protein
VVCIYWLFFLVSATHHLTSKLHTDDVFPLLTVYSMSPTASTLTPSLLASSMIMGAIGDATASAAASRIDVVGEELGTRIQGCTTVGRIHPNICF